MIRFIRNLILVLIVLAAIAYLAAYYYTDAIVDRCEKPVTRALIALYGPGEDDEYGYQAGITFWPPRLEVENLRVSGSALRVDGSVFNECEIGVGRVSLDLYPLLKQQQVVVKEMEGVTFSGRLTLERLAERLERTGGALSDVTVDLHRRKARVRGRFGQISVSTITVLGLWAVDDRGVITLVDREYYNPDSPVPEGAIRVIEDQTNLDVRIEVLGEGLVAEEVTFGSSGLSFSAHD